MNEPHSAAPPTSPGRALDNTLSEHERRTIELEARVTQLELIARSRGIYLPEPRREAT